MGADIRPEDHGRDCKPSIHFRQLAISFSFFPLIHGIKTEKRRCRSHQTEAGSRPKREVSLSYTFSTWMYLQEDN